MFGIIIGAAAALGTLAFCRRRYHARWGQGRRWAHHGYYGHHARCGHGGPGYGPYDGGDEGYDAPPWARGGWRRDGRGPGPTWRRGGFADRWSDMLAWQLDATAEQAEVFRKEFRSVREELRSLGDERGATLGDLGKALGGERFDAEVMGELFARHDQRLEQLRRALVGALANIHAVLEPAQRERLAKLIGRRGFGFGPYRG